MKLTIQQWGSSLWDIIHIISSINNFIVLKSHYKSFFDSLVNLIPCIVCKIHYMSYIRSYPILKLKDSNSFCVWVNNLHNSVNKRTRKKIFSLEQSKKRYIHDNHIKITKNICVILKYHINTMTPIKFKSFKKMFLALINIIPCNHFKEKLIEFNKNNNINNTTIQSIKEWYSKLNLDNIIIERNKTIQKEKQDIKSV